MDSKENLMWLSQFSTTDTEQTMNSISKTAISLLSADASPSLLTDTFSKIS